MKEFDSVMKRTIKMGALSGAVVAALALAGCSSGGSGDAGQSGETGGGSSSGALDVFVNMPTGSPQETVMKDLVSKFEEQDGTKVNLMVAATSFEDDMKVKMASDSVPDVFSTHGWSVLRYSPFLTPLENEPWAQYMNPGLDNTMLDADGHLYALPLEYSTTGLIVNYDVLEAAGVKVDSLKTWDGLDAAMAAIKEKSGISPFTSSGKESNAGDVGNFIASGQFTPAQLTAFTDGTFDTAVWESGVSDHIEKWQKAGYFNPDFVSATLDDMSRQLAEGTAAFALSWPFVIGTALEYNPDANIGFVPIPGVEGEYLVGGEGVSAFGVAKNSKNPEAAMKFLAFLAEPENAKALLAATGAYSGLTNVEVDLGNLQADFDKYVASGDIPTKPFFDRVYLPNGMWNTIITTTDALINGQSTSAEAAKQMAEQFQTLYGQE